MSLQTTRRVWLHSTSFASLTLNSQHSSKTSQASAFTHHITSGCVETILCLWPHHICQHHFSPTPRVSSSAAVSTDLFSWNLDFCKPALSLVLIGSIHGSQLYKRFLVENQLIIKCFLINLNTVIQYNRKQHNQLNMACWGTNQGGRGWLAFGDYSRIHQSFRRARICKLTETYFFYNWGRIGNLWLSRDLHTDMFLQTMTFVVSSLKAGWLLLKAFKKSMLIVTILSFATK